MKKITNKRPKKPHLSLPCESWKAFQGFKSPPFTSFGLRTAKLIRHLFLIIIMGFVNVVFASYRRFMQFKYKLKTAKYSMILLVFVLVFALISVDHSQTKKQETIETIIATSEKNHDFGQISNAIGWESWDEDFVLPVSGYKSQGYFRGHNGIDYATEIYSPVHPVTAGEVIHAGWEQGGYGISVIIDHGHDLVARYAHLANTKVKVGDKVRTGDIVGEVGLTGRTSGPHVHVEIYDQNVNINPENFIPLVK